MPHAWSSAQRLAVKTLGAIFRVFACVPGGTEKVDAGSDLQAGVWRPLIYSMRKELFLYIVSDLFGNNKGVR